MLSTLATRAVIWLADPTPSAPPAYQGDPNLVTPGAVGFAAIFFIAVATILLLLDMTRRIRRVRYREEVRALLDAESDDPTPPAAG